MTHAHAEKQEKKQKEEKTCSRSYWLKKLTNFKPQTIREREREGEETDEKNAHAGGPYDQEKSSQGFTKFYYGFTR